jgi:hypothetical protein
MVYVSSLRMGYGLPLEYALVVLELYLELSCVGAIASSFMNEGVEVVITVSPQQRFYQLWLDLRHLSASSVSPPVAAVSSPSMLYSPEWALNVKRAS